MPHLKTKNKYKHAFWENIKLAPIMHSLYKEDAEADLLPELDLWEILVSCCKIECSKNRLKVLLFCCA